MSIHAFSQNDDSYQKSPVFKACDSVAIDQLKTCFNTELYKFINANFQIPEIAKNDNYKGNVSVLFEVTKEGQFKVLYVDAVYNELKEEAKRVFELLPTITPGTYNGNPTYKQYSIPISIPLKEYSAPQTNNEVSNTTKDVNQLTKLEQQAKREFDSINKSLKKYEDAAYSSQLNIPFTHSYYARFGRQLNLVGTNTHTAAKPYLYEDVSKYYNFKEEKEALIKGTNSWWERKLFNEHLVEIQSEDYWFTIDPIFDFSGGINTFKDGKGSGSVKDTEGTFANTRGVYLQGGLGKKLSFSASIYESQARFADYFNRFAETLKAFGPDPGIIPGRGIAKRFKSNAFDFPVAEGYLSYSPTDFLNIQFGHGKNFIGDGYRSLLQSDNASPYPYLKLNTKFWKIKYTNTWMWLRDVRPEVTEDGAFLTKYMANHYLSWNVSKKLNIGLFESVMWTNTNDRGFDINYLNPIIFYRAIEFATGPAAGNAIIGLSGKYKWNDNINGKINLDFK